MLIRNHAKVAVHIKILFLLLMLFPLLAQALQIKGIEGKLAENVHAYVDPLAISVLTPRNRRLLETEMTKAMQALGYYHPSFTYAGGRDQELVITISKGQPMLIDTLNLKLLGEAQDDPVFRRIFSRAGFRRGDRLDHGAYEEWKQRVNSWAKTRGYLDAKWLSHEIRVDSEKNVADIEVRWDSGPRYRFGRITVEGAQIDRAKLASFRPFAPGDKYRANAITDYTQKLIASGWFDMVLVTPQPPDNEQHTIDVTVQLTPQVKNRFDVGGGFSTDDEGPRFKLGWTRPWINRRGDRVSASLQMAKPQQTLEGQYLIPIDHPQKNTYTLNWGYQHTDNEDTLSDELSVGVARNWKPDRGWQRAVSFRWLYEDFEQGEDSGSTNLFLPGFSVNRIRYLHHRGDPYADRLRLSVELSDPVWGSELRLARAQTRLSFLETVARKHRLLARIDAGAVVVKPSDFDDVPSSLRFFAGGDLSVRGYGYESLSPRDDDGNLLGGKYLLAGSVGYQYQVAPKWWLATFYDIGGAFNTFSRSSLYASYGFGVRWWSPVAPIRVDIAHGLDNQDDAFRIHIGIGMEL